MIDKIDESLAADVAMAGVPDFLDIPEDMQDKIAKATVAKERFFWLNAGSRLPKNAYTEALLRRAIYAEQRVLETEFMIGEMALICEGAKERVQKLEAKLDEVVKVT